MVNNNPGVSVSLRASSQSIVHGCPGVPRSIVSVSNGGASLFSDWACLDLI